MANENISPEERLFKIIQEGKNPSSGKPSPRKKIKIDLRGIKGFFANLKPKAAVSNEQITAPSLALPIKFQEIEPKAINKILIGILGFITILTINATVNKGHSIAKISTAISRIQIQAMKNKTIEAFKPLSSYMEEVKNRDIFTRLAVEAKAATGSFWMRGGEAQDKLKDMAKDLKLVGISWGNSPKAMIRSEKENNTYFLKQGQTIGMTGIELKTIFKNKVVINYQGSEMELF